MLLSYFIRINIEHAYEILSTNGTSSAFRINSRTFNERCRSWHRVSKISLAIDSCLTFSKSLERPSKRSSDEWDALLFDEFERVEFAAKCTVVVKSIKKDIDQAIDNAEKSLKNKDSAKSSK